MKQYEVVLAIMPAGGETTPAVERAAELARASGAALHLCVFDHDPAVEFAAGRSGPDIAEHAKRDIMRGHEGALEQVAARLAGREHPVECDVVWAPDMARAVVGKAVQVGAQLVVKDARHESAVRRLLFTPLDWKLMRLLPCEVMLVGSAAPVRPRRIVAAIDVWAESAATDGLNERVMEAATRLAEDFDARLDFVSVFPFFPSLQNRALPSSKAMYAEANSTHYEAFSKFVEAHGIPEDRRHRLSGLPAAELIRFAAEQDVDVLVLGSLHRQGWDRFFLGSTAEAVGQESTADVVLVKSAAQVEALRHQAAG